MLHNWIIFFHDIIMNQQEETSSEHIILYSQKTTRKPLSKPCFCVFLLFDVVNAQWLSQHLHLNPEINSEFIPTNSLYCHLKPWAQSPLFKRKTPVRQCTRIFKFLAPMCTVESHDTCLKSAPPNWNLLNIKKVKSFWENNILLYSVQSFL